jgi:hypothetical protein
MAEWLADARIVDLILGLMLAEGAALWAYHRATGSGPAPRAVLAMLVAGASLMLALRGALLGASWVWIAIALFAAGVAHVADLRQRWPRSRHPVPGRRHASLSGEISRRCDSG